MTTRGPGGTRVGKRLGKVLSNRLFLDLCEPSLLAFPNCLYVLDADNAHESTISAGKADYVLDEWSGSQAVANPVGGSTLPSISTTDITGHKTIQMVSAQQGFALVTALANALAGGADFTFVCRVKEAFTTGTSYYQGHSSGSPQYSASGINGNTFVKWGLVSSPANGDIFQQQSGGAPDTNYVTHSRDTSWRTRGISATGGAGGTLTSYSDGVAVGTQTRGSAVPAAQPMTFASFGCFAGATAMHFKLWGGWSYCFTAADHLAAHALVLDREA